MKIECFCTGCPVKTLNESVLRQLTWLDKHAVKLEFIQLQKK
ncbi:hypothetical protein [Escherichia coli IS5]|nr:hypothetical protein [Escherichia coli IS5]